MIKNHTLWLIGGIAIYLLVPVVIWLIFTLTHEIPQTVYTTEVYTNYTILKINDEITEIFVDSRVYEISCDGRIESNENGHTCVLAGKYDSISEFMAMR